MPENPVLVTVEDGVGTITLNRPGALNALTLDMIVAITRQLRDWVDNDAITHVAFAAVEGRAFSAGGDINALYYFGRQGDFEFANNFWRLEYTLNHLIATYPKPTISIVDGIVMGGGVGIATHCTHRFMTDNAVFAMPECGIGLIPDVGSSLLLAHSPGRCGEYIALTGARLTASDCLYAGLCDRVVEGQVSQAVLQDLLDDDKSDAERQVGAAGTSELFKWQDEIDTAFGFETVSAIVEKLSARDDEWAVSTLSLLDRGAPLSLISALHSIREARQHGSLAEALKTEFRFVSRASRHGEFLEGTRAAIIDKDRKPRWQYPDIEAVPPELLRTMRSRADGGDFQPEGVER